jgi:hypothetical protein
MTGDTLNIVNVAYMVLIMLDKLTYILSGHQCASLAVWGFGAKLPVLVIPDELVETDVNAMCSEIHKLVSCVWNKKEFSKQWKKTCVVPIEENGGKTSFSNYRGTSCY